MPNVNRLGTPTWECVHFWDELDIGTVQQLFPSFHVGAVYGNGLASEQELMVGLAAAFHFPSWFGHNWDAVRDCLRDLDWIGAPGYILVVYDAAQLWRDSLAPSMGTLVSVWLSVAEEWAQIPAPFHIVFVWQPAASAGREHSRMMDSSSPATNG